MKNFWLKISVLQDMLQHARRDTNTEIEWVTADGRR